MPYSLQPNGAKQWYWFVPGLQPHSEELVSVVSPVVHALVYVQHASCTSIMSACALSSLLLVRAGTHAHACAWCSASQCHMREWRCKLLDLPIRFLPECGCASTPGMPWPQLHLWHSGSLLYLRCQLQLFHQTCGSKQASPGVVTECVICAQSATLPVPTCRRPPARLAVLPTGECVWLLPLH